tara:strand:+ start:287 stop:529 length:243 start_codon:yes stop_codon:yes gene_type:complete
MCAELKLRRHQIDKQDDMNMFYNFELITDNQDNFTLNDVEYNHPYPYQEESGEHVFIVSLSLCGFFFIMYNIINYLKLIN